MLLDFLMIFVLITIILFLITIFIMEDYPKLALPIVSLGLVFSVICAYGFWKVEYFYVGYNGTTGLSETNLFSTYQYGDPYSYIFVLVFFIFMALFFKIGFNMWRDALKQQGEMEYMYNNKYKPK